MQMEKERELVSRTLDGDENAFGHLYRNYQPRIYATVRGRTRDLDDVDDLVQATFIRAYQGLAGFRGEAAFSTWLTQIAMNLCTSHVRSQRARRARLDVVAEPETEIREVWEPARLEDPSEALDRKEDQALLIRAIGRLPKSYRRAMWLRYVEDRSYLEIMGELGVPMGTVKSWLHRARQQLETEIRGEADSGTSGVAGPEDDPAAVSDDTWPTIGDDAADAGWGYPARIWQ
jgi:RNA polymerase sigma-70 factor, ECF subfamily